MSQRLRVGVAVGSNSLAAEWRAVGKTTAWTVSFGLDGSVRPTADMLRSAFADLQTRLPSDRASLAIAILPPLARLRRIEMPRMTDEECRRAVTRSAERY